MIVPVSRYDPDYPLLARLERATVRLEELGDELWDYWKRRTTAAVGPSKEGGLGGRVEGKDQ